MILRQSPRLFRSLATDFHLSHSSSPLVSRRDTHTIQTISDPSPPLPKVSHLAHPKDPLNPSQPSSQPTPSRTENPPPSSSTTPPGPSSAADAPVNTTEESSTSTSTSTSHSNVPSTVQSRFPSYTHPPFHTHAFFSALEKTFPTPTARSLMRATRALLVDRVGRVRREGLTAKDLDNVRVPLLDVWRFLTILPIY
jgi:hypothetical protein